MLDRQRHWISTHINLLYPRQDPDRLDNQSPSLTSLDRYKMSLPGRCLLKESATKYMQPNTNYARTRTAFAVVQAPYAPPHCNCQQIILLLSALDDHWMTEEKQPTGAAFADAWFKLAHVEVDVPPP